MNTKREELPSGVASRPDIVEFEWIGAPGADPSQPDLFFEVPHGATLTSHYERTRALLAPTLPPDLSDFFYVNTDVGSTEYGRAVAREVAMPGAEVRALLDDATRAWLDAAPPRGVLLARSLVPRTFIDVNRVVEPQTERDGMTAAIADYVREPRDIETLLGLHAEYHAEVGRAYERVCGAGRLAFMPHTYAPKSVSIDSFDEGIGAALRKAYEPELYATWSVRPEIDVISEAPDGTMLAPIALIEALRAQLTGAEFEMKENASYRLHPVTMGHRYSARYPGQVLCVEVRRDLLADPFSPFEEMKIGTAKIARVARPMAAAFLQVLAAR
ncbi:MAG: hypothetical protein U0527_01560 [Candidatus Eisenbacteria bacterium]